MSEQPVAPRPRFRLPSMVRRVELPPRIQAPSPPAPPPTLPGPPPESQPPIVPVLSEPIRPSSTTMANGSVVTVQAEPPQTPPKPTISSTTSVPSSPRPSVASRSPTPPHSPKDNVKAPPPSPRLQSPKSKPLSPPPLPMPTSEIKMVHPEPEIPKSPFAKSESPPLEVVGKKSLLLHEINKKTENDKDVAQKKESGQGDKAGIMAYRGRGLRSTISPSKYGDEEAGMRVITVAGENRGAYMELASSHWSNKKLDKWQNFNYHGSATEGSKNEPRREGNIKSKKLETPRTAKTPPMNVLANSNVQSVNNSILFRSSCVHNDPGVHLALSRRPAPPTPQAIRLKNNGDGLHD